YGGQVAGIRKAGQRPGGGGGAEEVQAGLQPSADAGFDGVRAGEGSECGAGSEPDDCVGCAGVWCAGDGCCVVVAVSAVEKLRATLMTSHAREAYTRRYEKTSR